MDEIDLLVALTQQLSAALEGAQLYDATQRRASREQLTREITDRLRAALDWDELLQVAVQEMGDALGASRAFVQWMEPETLPETPVRTAG
jgi:GAF domain-containing protein